MELLERDAPLTMLAGSLRDATAGLGHIALVYGEAGIGKTALLERFMAAHRAEARMLLGRCDALFTPQPPSAEVNALTVATACFCAAAQHYCGSGAGLSASLRK